MSGIKQGNPEKPFCNAEGYTDLTAYEAEKKIEKEENDMKHRIGKTVEALKVIARLMGFDIKGRVVLVDSKTGKEYR